VLSFLAGNGLYVDLPASGASIRAWLTATAPACALGALGVRAGWRGGVWTAGITGFLGSCAGTAAILALTIVSLAIVQPQLMKIGMSWESLRDAASVLRNASLIATAASLAGGLAGAIAARGRVTGARR
jgi:hypothetical protein